MTNALLTSGKQFSKNFLHSIFGLVIICWFLLCTICSLPIFLYRWIICQVLGPLCRRGRGKAVTLGGAMFATELTKKELRAKPRFTLVSRVGFEGAVDFEEFKDRAQRLWIDARESQGGRLKYPEFQQYVDSWMGYLFWEHDKSFSLDNHMVHSKCEDSWTEQECEQYARSTVEDSMNNAFPKGRSPWGIHMISNFKTPELLPDGKRATILVCRFHHCIADGFAVTFLFFDTLLGIPFSKSNRPQPPSKSRQGGSIANCLRKFGNFMSFPIKLIRDLGHAGSLSLTPIKTPWYVPEDKRSGLQLYARSKKLPISRLKFVKDRVGVTFTSVLLSCVTAAIARSFKAKGFPNNHKMLPFALPVPMKNHPHKLRNHWAASLYEIPIDQTLSPIERLRQTEKQFQKSKQSTLPYIFKFSMTSAALQLPFVARVMAKNEMLSTAMSSFPGPRGQIRGFDRDIIGMEFGGGLAYGVAGLGFFAISYNDHIRISIVAENAAMERHELEELFKFIFDEVDKLEESAKNEELLGLVSV